MRTPKRLYTAERLIYHPELLTCPYCGAILAFLQRSALVDQDETVSPLAMRLLRLYPG